MSTALKTIPDWQFDAPAAWLHEPGLDGSTTYGMLAATTEGRTRLAVMVREGYDPFAVIALMTVPCPRGHDDGLSLDELNAAAVKAIGPFERIQRRDPIAMPRNGGGVYGLYTDWMNAYTAKDFKAMHEAAIVLEMQGYVLVEKDVNLMAIDFTKIPHVSGCMCARCTSTGCCKVLTGAKCTCGAPLVYEANGTTPCAHGCGGGPVVPTIPLVPTTTPSALIFDEDDEIPAAPIQNSSFGFDDDEPMEVHRQSAGVPEAVGDSSGATPERLGEGGATNPGPGVTPGASTTPVEKKPRGKKSTVEIGGDGTITTKPREPVTENLESQAIEVQREEEEWDAVLDEIESARDDAYIRTLEEKHDDILAEAVAHAKREGAIQAAIARLTFADPRQAGWAAKRILQLEDEAEKMKRECAVMVRRSERVLENAERSLRERLNTWAKTQPRKEGTKTVRFPNCIHRITFKDTAERWEAVHPRKAIDSVIALFGSAAAAEKAGALRQKWELVLAQAKQKFDPAKVPDGFIYEPREDKPILYRK